MKVENPQKKKQKGAALVETSLVLLTVLGMIVFVMDMGRILLTQQFIAERARVAVRNSVVNSWSSTQVANYVVYGDPNASGQSSSGLMGITTSQVTFNQIADSGVGDARYQVTVTGVPLFTWIPYMAGQYTAPSVIATASVQSKGATN